MPNPRAIAETDLYAPLRDYLVAQGYTVRGEVKHCDLTAVKGEELIVIEMKKAFSIALLLQATKRQRLTDSVYVALLKPKPSRAWPGIRHLLKRLELGLIVVSPGARTQPVKVLFHPVPFRRQKRQADTRAVLAETTRRTGDFTPGGSHRRKIVSAYRERALHIACCLHELGALSPKALRELGTGEKTQSILYANVYGWFERVGVGRYALSPQGREALTQYPQLTAHFRSLVPRQQLSLGEEGDH